MPFPLWTLIAAFLAPSAPFALVAAMLWGLAPLWRSRGTVLPVAVLARPRGRRPARFGPWTWLRIGLGLALGVGLSTCACSALGHL